MVKQVKEECVGGGLRRDCFGNLDGLKELTRLQLS